MTTTINQQHIIEKISTLTVAHQLVSTIFVDQSIGDIEIDRTHKVGNRVTHIKEVLHYKLSPHRFIIKNCKHSECNLIISDIPTFKTIEMNKCICETASYGFNQAFIMELRNSKNIIREKIDFFNQGFFRKIFNRVTESGLCSKILECSSGCSWMIVPDFIFEIFKKNDLFEEIECKSDFLFRNVGRMGGINVYLNTTELDPIIYFGNYDSITIILNKNIGISSARSMKPDMESDRIISVDYQFVENGLLKMLEIN